VDGNPVVKGKTRVATGEVCCCVLLQLCGECRERVREVLQEREHLFEWKQVLHHYEAHEVQAEVMRDRGGFYWCAQPVRVGCPAVWVGS
jgi:hypothetical protein